ncbi:MAG: universal stress protein [Haloarculaceae archaeon]
MANHVLVPTDGSPLSEQALRHAFEHFPDARVTVLHVVDLFEPGYGAYPEFDSTYEPLMGSEEWYDRAEAVSRRLFEEARDVAATYDRSIETTSDIGDPKRIIVEYADDEDLDHIVLGAHGRAEADRSLYGSVSEIVARRATVPVTIVR